MKGTASVTALHRAEISGILLRWLERYSPPAAMKDNPRAQQDEADSLLAVLLRFAPHDEAGPWVRRALDRLEYQMKTRAWPTKGEMAAICSDLRKQKPDAILADGLDMRPEAITARRMQKGEAVGESWLYGRLACELIASGLIDRDLMARYRSAAFMARKAEYGEAAALAWEAEAKQRHEDAKTVRREVAQRMAAE